jgi:hypothetical protein
LARTSGTTTTPRSRRIASASGVVEGANASGVLLRDLAGERAGREHLALDLEQLPVRERVGAGEADQRAGLLLEPGQGRGVEAAGGEHAPARVRRRDDPGAGLAEELRQRLADVAPALDRDAGAVEVQAHALGRLAGRDRAAAPGRLGTPLGAPDRERLAGHDCRHRVAGVHRVGVHNPGHHAGVGVDVRRGDVALRADQDRDLAREAAGEVLELAEGEPLRVDGHAALRPAERQADHGALPGHPHRQRADVVQVDVGVVADAALGRPARDVVLDAVAAQHRDRAVVHAHREVHRQLALAAAQDGAQAVLQPEAVSRGVELGERAVPCVLDRRLGRSVRGVAEHVVSPPYIQSSCSDVGCTRLLLTGPPRGGPYRRHATAAQPVGHPGNTRTAAPAR